MGAKKKNWFMIMTALLTNSIKGIYYTKILWSNPKIRTESEKANQSKTSLGFKYSEHAVVEVSDKITSLGFKNL